MRAYFAPMSQRSTYLTYSFETLNSVSSSTWSLMSDARMHPSLDVNTWQDFSITARSFSLFLLSLFLDFSTKEVSFLAATTKEETRRDDTPKAQATSLCVYFPVWQALMIDSTSAADNWCFLIVFWPTDSRISYASLALSSRFRVPEDRSYLRFNCSRPGYSGKTARTRSLRF